MYDLSDHVLAANLHWRRLGAAYIYLGGQFVAQYPKGTTYFVHRDHLGSIRMLTAMDQSLYDRMDYQPFGEQILGGSGTSYKFTGKERDSESGLGAGRCV